MSAMRRGARAELGALLILLENNWAEKLNQAILDADG